MAGLLTAPVRNIVLLGHSGAGKTTLLEALLHRAGAIERRGRVEDGTTTLGSEPEELRHHASLSLATTTLQRGDELLNFLDTPGLPDFVSEVELALPVADLALVVVSATEGVEVQTEQLWRLAEVAGLPRLLFINKLDLERADYEATLQQCLARFGEGLAPLELPLFDGGRFVGVADLLADEAIIYREGRPEAGAIPEEIAALEHKVRENLVEGIVVADDDLMNRYLDGDTPTPLELEEALAAGIEAGSVFPVLCGAAASEVALERLLDFLCEIAHPRPALLAGEDAPLVADPAGETVVRVVKTTLDPFVGRTSLLQVVSGRLRPDALLTNVRSGGEERLHQLQRRLGAKLVTVEEAGPGELVVVSKLADTLAGDTLAQKGSRLRLAAATLSPPQLSTAIRPRTTGEEERLMGALHRLLEEDPALAVRRDDEHHQTLLAGLGEQHLQVALERLARKFGVEVSREEVALPLRETITQCAAAEGRHRKQSGGHGQFGVAHLRLEPLERGAGFEFVDEVTGGAIPRQFIPAVERGVRRQMAHGGAYGYPVVDVRVICDDGKAHPVDSSEASFEQAGALAFTEALALASPVLLEPVTRLVVELPARYLGEVLGDLGARRAHIVANEPREGDRQRIEALVPTSELARYAVELRALAGGYASFEAIHDHYEPLPEPLRGRYSAAGAGAGAKAAKSH